MKRKIIVLLLLTVLLTGKYFLSPCPDLPRSFYSSPVSVSSSQTGDTALQTGSAWTKALVWLNCYCSVPRLTEANLSLPLRLKRRQVGDLQSLQNGDGDLTVTTNTARKIPGKRFPGIFLSLRYRTTSRGHLLVVLSWMLLCQSRLAPVPSQYLFLRLSSMITAKPRSATAVRMTQSIRLLVSPVLGFVYTLWKVWLPS